MSELRLPTKDSVLQASAEHSGDVITLILSGTADSTTRDEFADMVADVHSLASGKHASEVCVDLRDLEFMNSSCLKSLVSWVQYIRDLSAEQRYQLRLVSNPERRWQRRSLAALSCFAVDLVTIQTD